MKTNINKEDIQTFYKMAEMIAHNPKEGDSYGYFIKFNKIETSTRKEYDIVIERQFKNEPRRSYYYIEVTESEITYRINGSTIEYNLVNNEDTSLLLLLLYYGNTLLQILYTDATGKINFLNNIPNIIAKKGVREIELNKRIRKKDR